MDKALLIMLFVLPLALLAAGTARAEGETTLVRVCEGLQFPEGPAWDGEGAVYVSNCSEDYITRVGQDGNIQRKWLQASSTETPLTFKKTNGMAFAKDGSLFACDHGRNAIIRIRPDRTCEIWADACAEVPFHGPNDLAFDRAGNLYFTDPKDSGLKNPIGAVYRVAHDSRTVCRVAGGMAFPNGLAFTADGNYLYVCESQRNRIVRFAVHKDGTLGPLVPFADLSPDGPGEPDGMAVDEAGRLWIAHYAAHTVLVVDTEGKIVRTIRLPHTKDQGPTNIEFGGADMRDAYVTDPGSDALWKLRSDVAGLRLFGTPESKR